MTLLKLGLLLFWAAWFSIVFLTNLFGGMKALGILPQGWRFASKNYEAVVAATAMYRPAPWVAPALFAIVVMWQMNVAALFAWTLIESVKAGTIYVLAANWAFGAGIALWAAFMLADEITLKYEFERTHELLFIAQLASLIALHVL